jgi:hypothetical protein
MSLVRGTIETTLYQPCTTTEFCEGITEDIAHLVRIDSCIVPVLREEEYESPITLFESGGFQVDDKSWLGCLQRFEETDIGEWSWGSLDHGIIGSWDWGVGFLSCRQSRLCL